MPNLVIAPLGIEIRSPAAGRQSASNLLPAIEDSQKNNPLSLSLSHRHTHTITLYSWDSKTVFSSLLQFTWMSFCVAFWDCFIVRFWRSLNSAVVAVARGLRSRKLIAQMQMHLKGALFGACCISIALRYGRDLAANVAICCLACAFEWHFARE